MLKFSDIKPGPLPVTRVPREPPAGPSLARQAVNYGIATVQHVAKGSPTASDATVAARFATCESCPLFARTSATQGQCRHKSCGCTLATVGVTGTNKLRWADQRCPLGKWLPVADGE